METTYQKIDYLYSYVIKVNAGFAPNFGTPDNSICTLACCKGPMRKSIRILLNNKPQSNIWVIATPSVDLIRKYGFDSPVYLMKVTEIETFEDYYNKEKYQFKKIENFDKRYGKPDNYYTNSNSKEQIKRIRKENPDFAHNFINCKKVDTDKIVKKDVDSDCVLVSELYYNFTGCKIDDFAEVNQKLFHGQGFKFNYNKEDFKIIKNYLEDKINCGEWDKYKKRIFISDTNETKCCCSTKNLNNNEKDCNC